MDNNFYGSVIASKCSHPQATVVNLYAFMFNLPYINFKM